MMRTLTAVIAIALLLAACGGDDDTTSQPGSSATVSIGDAGDLGDVLVDSSGRTLYVAEQEADGTVQCTSSCLDTWPALTIPEGDTPTAGDGVDGTLATVVRDDDTVQVTYEGFPLYTFAGDASPGDVAGNGLSDEFDGISLTWRVATPSGTAPGGNTPGGGDTSSGYSY